MVKMSDWIQGEIISWKGMTGYVNFISDEYITMCIREYDKSEECAEHSRQKQNTVCLLIFPNDWSEVERERTQ